MFLPSYSLKVFYWEINAFILSHFALTTVSALVPVNHISTRYNNLNEALTSSSLHNKNSKNATHAGWRQPCAFEEETRFQLFRPHLMKWRSLTQPRSTPTFSQPRYIPFIRQDEHQRYWSILISSLKNYRAAFPLAFESDDQRWHLIPWKTLRGYLCILSH